MITQYNVLRRRLETEWVNVRAATTDKVHTDVDAG